MVRSLLEVFCLTCAVLLLTWFILYQAHMPLKNENDSLPQLTLEPNSISLPGAAP